jgi:DNA-binding GntR family transcriptional regulator
MPDRALGEQLGGGFGAGQRRESIAQEGYRWLKKKIGTIPRDVGVIISEAEVIEGAGIGRTPAREALQRLEVEGHLRIIPRKGIYIAPISDAEMRYLIDSRRAVERWSGEEVTARNLLNDETLADLVAEQESRLADAESFIESDRAFHEAIVTAAGNPIMSAFYEQLRDRQVRLGLSAILQESGRAAVVLDEHRAIASAIRAGDLGATQAAIGEHLDSTLSAALHLQARPPLGQLRNAEGNKET